MSAPKPWQAREPSCRHDQAERDEWMNRVNRWIDRWINQTEQAETEVERLQVVASDLRAERDALRQAIDAAVALLDEADAHPGYFFDGSRSPGILETTGIRAALAAAGAALPDQETS